MAGVSDDASGDDAAIRRLRRSPPPAAAITWASKALGGAVVEAVEPLRGGSSSAMHLLTVRHGSGHGDRAVLRRYVGADARTGPYDAEQEARALGLVEAVSLPTPRLLGCDPTGEEAGAPAVLMSELAGRPVWDARRPDRWVHRLAEILVALGGVKSSSLCDVRPYAPYRQRSYVPPAWAQRPEAWERAIEIFHGPTLDGPSRFVHRDFHPGNLLWRRGQLTGVVDWQSASVGPPSVDVGHCRTNLLFYAAHLAEPFARYWEELNGGSYHPWADIVALIGLLDSFRAQPPAPPARTAIDEVIARAVSEVATR